MSTRCTIGIKRQDGTFADIYCHYDGYLSGVGKELFENWNTAEKVELLIEGGTMSSLGSTIEACKFHHTSFGEKREDTLADTYASYKEYRNSDWFQSDSWIEFIYLFKDGKWWWFSTCGEKFKPLTEKVILKEEEEHD